MSGREWQPGDVAMVGYDGQPERVMLRAEVERAHGLRACWLDSAYRIYDDQGRVQSARPLVVIDPEDREQVERLDDIYQKALDGAPKFHSLADVMQAALREFANPTPPRPEEPTGLGAVVEDVEGLRWVRIGENGHAGVDDWKYAGTLRGNGKNDWVAYSEINAVRILSPGVQP